MISLIGCTNYILVGNGPIIFRSKSVLSFSGRTNNDDLAGDERRRTERENVFNGQQRDVDRRHGTRDRRYLPRGTSHRVRRLYLRRNLVCCAVVVTTIVRGGSLRKTKIRVYVSKQSLAIRRERLAVVLQRRARPRHATRTKISDTERIHDDKPFLSTIRDGYACVLSTRDSYGRTRRSAGTVGYAALARSLYAFRTPQSGYKKKGENAARRFIAQTGTPGIA